MIPWIQNNNEMGEQFEFKNDTISFVLEGRKLKKKYTIWFLWCFSNFGPFHSYEWPIYPKHNFQWSPNPIPTLVPKPRFHTNLKLNFHTSPQAQFPH